MPRMGWLAAGGAAGAAGAARDRRQQQSGKHAHGELLHTMRFRQLDTSASQFAPIFSVPQRRVGGAACTGGTVASARRARRFARLARRACRWRLRSHGVPASRGDDVRLASAVLAALPSAWPGGGCAAAGLRRRLLRLGFVGVSASARRRDRRFHRDRRFRRRPRGCGLLGRSLARTRRRRLLFAGAGAASTPLPAPARPAGSGSAGFGRCFGCRLDTASRHALLLAATSAAAARFRLGLAPLPRRFGCAPAFLRHRCIVDAPAAAALARALLR